MGTTQTAQITGTFPTDQGGNTTCGIPTNAEAIEINVVGIQPQTLGNFVASATGGIVNFGPLNPAMNNANAATISVNGQLNIYTNAGPQNTGQPIAHTRGTITGYYTPTN